MTKMHAKVIPQVFIAVILYASLAFAQVPWLPTNGPFGGSADMIVEDPVVPGVMYVRTSGARSSPTGAELYRTQDNGTTWQRLTFADRIVDLIAGSQAVYASTVSGGSSSLMTTSDGGLTWTVYSSSIADPSCRDQFGGCLAADATPGTLYLANSAGSVFRLTAPGQSWEQLLTGWPFIGGLPIVATALAGDDNNPGTVFACNLLGLYRYAGASWTKVSGRLPDSNQGCGALRLDPVRPGTLYSYAITNFSTVTPIGPYRSTDGGVSWDLPVVPAYQCLSLRCLTSDRAGNLYATGPGPLDNGVFVSRDAGSSWVPLVTAGLPPVDVSTHPYPNVAGVSNASGAVFTSVGCCFPSGPTGLGLYRLDPGATTWRQVNSGFASAWVSRVGVDPRRPRRVLAELPLNSESVSRSDDTGRTWTVATSTPNLGDNLRTQGIAFDAGTPDVAYIGNAALWKTVDGGQTWESISVASTSCLTTFNGVIVRTDPVTPNLVYIACLTGGGGFVFRSADGGVTWQPLAQNIPFGVDDLLVDRLNPQTLYLINTRVSRSTDGGLTFTPIDDALPSGGGRTALADPSVPHGWYVVAGSRLYRTSNGGDSWTLMCSSCQYGHMLPDPSRPGVLYGLNDGFNEGNVTQLHWSRDFGQTWNLRFAFRMSTVEDWAIEPAGGGVLYFATRNESIRALSVAGLSSQPFTDDPLIAGSSMVRAIHITELRARIDAVRARYALMPYAYSNSQITVGISVVMATDITQMR